MSEQHVLSHATGNAVLVACTVLLKNNYGKMLIVKYFKIQCFSTDVYVTLVHRFKHLMLIYIFFGRDARLPRHRCQCKFPEGHMPRLFHLLDDRRQRECATGFRRGSRNASPLRSSRDIFLLSLCVYELRACVCDCVMFGGRALLKIVTHADWLFVCKQQNDFFWLLFECIT